MNLVEVVWVDSVSHCGSPWGSREELENTAEPHRCFTVGYLFLEDEQQLTLVMSYNVEEVGMALTIPRVAVCEIHVLRRDLPPLT